MEDGGNYGEIEGEGWKMVDNYGEIEGEGWKMVMQIWGD